MALHVVLGDGEMTKKELAASLNDLWEQAGDEPFWFIVQGKSEPTDTDKAFASWLHTNEIYYEVLTDDADSMADIYTSAQETHTAKKLAQKVVSILTTSPEDDESADVLALFASDDDDAEEDRWLNTILRAVAEEGFDVIAMNDGMVKLKLGKQAEAEAEEETPPPAPKKRLSKKAAAKPAPAAEEPEPQSYTREQLEDMEMAQLKQVATDMGIELPPRTRMSTYIDKILGEDKTPTAEIEEQEEAFLPEEAVTVNGDIDLEALAEEVTAMVIERLVSALQTQ